MKTKSGVSEGKKNPTLRDVHASLADVHRLLQVLTVKVTGLEQEVGSLKNSMEELTKRVNHIDAELANFKESVHDRFDIMNRRFDKFEGRMTTLEHVVLGQTDEIIKLTSCVNTMDQKFTLEIRELRVEIRDRVIVRIDNHEGRIYNLERRPAG